MPWLLPALSPPQYASKSRRRLIEMRIGEFVGGGGRQHASIVEHAPDNLQPNRQAVAGEAARDAHRRLLREIEGKAEGRPVHPGVAVLVLRGELAHIEGRCGDRWRQQEIVSLHELPHAAAVLPTRRVGGEILLE